MARFIVVKPDSVLQDRVLPGHPSTVDVMTLREDLVQKEVADISENYTIGIPVIDKHFRTRAIFS